MKTSISAMEANKDAIGSVEDMRVVARSRRISPITITFLSSVAFVGFHTAFQRIGTTANAEVVEYTRNLAGGFLAVGMTHDQPGFIALSALDQDDVDISAAQASTSLAGTHTVVDIRTPRGTTRTRLRGPQVILVTELGDVETFAVDWTLEEFNALRKAVDCSHEAAFRKNRCGAPFTDLQEALRKWPTDRVPDRVRAFLVPFVDRRSRQ